MQSSTMMGAGEYASRLGVTPETLRNWRRIGIDPGGAAVNNRKRYKEFDVLAGRIMLHLHREMFELGDAWRIAERLAPWLCKSFDVECPDWVNDKGGHFFGDYPDFAIVQNGSNVILSDDLSEFKNVKGSVFVAVSVERLIDQLKAS